MKTPIQSGWQCPCCKVVYAPSVMKCECAKAQEQKPTDDNNKAREEYERMLRESHKARIKPERPWYPPRPLELAPNVAPYLDPTTRPMCTGDLLPVQCVTTCSAVL